MSPDRPHDDNCIFCKIISGQIPCHRIYEDDHALSFLDIGPLSRGHTLVIPKGHWVTLDQMPDDATESCARACRDVGRAVAAAIDCQGWNVLQNNGKAAGQVVMHVHFHLIPRQADDNLGYRWPAGELDNDTAVQLRQAITGHLGR